MRFAILALATTASAQCASSSTLCEPSGASSLTPPQISDPNFASLYKNLLDSSLPSFKPKRSLLVESLEERQSTTGSSLCCITSLSCLLVSTLNIPFCYDRFTTNFFLPDNSFGTLSSGSYTSSSGTANFKTGNYTLKNGQSGNMYPPGESAEKSAVATMSVPPQFTDAGVGSAIPASELGGVIVRTFTTTLSERTVLGTTVLGRTSTVTDVRDNVWTTTITGVTREPSTIPATEVVVTTTERVAATSTAETPSTSATGNSAGERVNVGMAMVLSSLGLVVCLL